MNKHTSAIINILKKAYSKAKIVLNYENNWELLVSVILSAQCTDKTVNQVTEKLFKKYPTLNDYINISPAELEQDIRQTGFFRNKTKNILAAATIIKQKFGEKLPKTMAEMLTIPGVARKTANVVLGNAYGIVEGIAVDTHVLRLSQRLHLVSQDKIGSNKKPVYFTKNLSPSLSGGAGSSSARRNVRSKRGNLILDYYKDASPEKIEQKLNFLLIPVEIFC